eukprot:g19167.t1
MTKLVFENLFQLWLQSSFFALTFKFTGPEARMKTVLSMAIGLLVLASKVPGLITELRTGPNQVNLFAGFTCGTFIAWILLLVVIFYAIVIVWITLKIVMAYQCDSHVLVGEHAKALRWQEALTLWAAGSNEVTYNSLIAACQRGSLWQCALAVLKDLESTLQSSVISYSSCLSALERSQWSKALNLWEAMEEKKIEADVIEPRCGHPDGTPTPERRPVTDVKTRTRTDVG